MYKKILKHITVAFTIGVFVLATNQVKAETVTEQAEATFASELPTVTPEVEKTEFPEGTNNPKESQEPETSITPEETKEPEVSRTPGESQQPEISNTPVVSNDPQVTVTSSESPLLSEYQGIQDYGNTSPNDATYMDVNTYILGQMKASEEQRWYLTSAPAGKLTVYITYQAESDIDMDLFLFKYNAEDGTINQVASSSCSSLFASNVEQLSYICDEGYYFIGISSSKGFDVNNKFTLLLLSSAKYDNKEADDAIEQRQMIEGIPVSINQTIDNEFDVDWVQFTVPQKKNIFGAFRNDSEDCNYIMTLYDSNLNKLGTISQGLNFDGLFSAGVYFVKIESMKGANPDDPYSLTFTPYDNFDTRQKVSGYGYLKDSIDNAKDENWIEYTLSEEGQVQFTLSNPSAKAQCVIDVCTMESNGTINVIDTINQEVRTHIALEPGTYYIRVRSISGYDPNTKYTLYIEKYGAFVYETESNNTFGTADLISLGDTIKGTISSKTDLDYYKVYINKYNKLTISMTGIPNGCDFDVRIYNTHQSCVIDSDNLNQQDEYVSFTPADYLDSESGYYYVKVFCDDGYSWSNKNYYNSSAKDSYYTLTVK